MFKRIDHVEIIPKDTERSLRFYCDILGFTLTERIEVRMPPMKEVIYARLGDTVIEFVSVDSPATPAENQWQAGFRAIALEVEDMVKAVAYLKAKGVGIHREPVDLGNSFRGEILDPDGLIIELRQWK